MNDITKHLISTYLPYVIAFLLGVLVAWKGCGDSDPTETTIIQKPEPAKIVYVDRWKYDTTRYTSTLIKYDTVTIDNITERIVLDTSFLIDTLKIVEAWLSEVVQYDTTAQVGGGAIRLRWQNYQNMTENLRIDYTPKKLPLKWAFGVHGNAGLISNFRDNYTPLFGVGLQVTVKKTYIAADYGFNGQHYIGARVGTNFIQR